MPNPFSSLFVNADEQLKTSSLISNDLIKSALEEHNKKKKEALGEVMLNIIGQADNAIQNHVNQLRELRKKEKDVRNKLAELNKAVAYFGETLNFGPLSKFIDVHPLCRRLGVDCPSAEDKKIPDSWEPKKES